MYKLAAPGTTVFYPVLVEFGKGGMSSLPEERTRPLSIGSFALAYLTSDEIMILSGDPNVVCMGLGGEPLESSVEARAHLWPKDLRIVKPNLSLNVLLAVIDVNSHALISLDKEFAKKVLLQCISGKNRTRKENNDITSVHGARMADVCRKLAPDVHFAVYDSSLERSDIVIGLDVIREYAKSLGVPVVVNLSASSQAGSHDGLSLWERAIGHYVGNDYSIVTSSGNTFDDDVHLFITEGALQGDNSIDIPLAIDSGISSARFELGLWFRGNSPTSCQIVGVAEHVIEVGRNSQSCYLTPELGLLIAYKGASEKGDDANITLAVRFVASPRSRMLIMRLYFAERATAKMRCDGWISSSPSHSIACEPYSAKRGTIESFSCSRGVVSVGTLRRENGRRVFQGIGPTRDGRLKPDIFVQTNASTSYAAAIVSGLVAQAMQTRAIREPQTILVALADQYRWLMLPEEVYGSHDDIR